MATIIKSVSFQNFYNYYGSFDDNTYRFKEGINIVNADNNMGKSKFYNGILWVLKDTVYDSDLKRMVSASSSFQKMASGKALSEETKFEMGVNITFSENADKYSVSKTVQFQKNGDTWKTNEKLEIMQTINNSDIPVNDTTEKEKIIKKIIPAELMNYALLQGESMEKLVDLSSHNGLSSTIEALAGINNLIEICDLSKDLLQKTKKLSNDKEKEINSTNKRITELIQDRETLESRIENTSTQIETYKTELSEATKKKETLEAILLNAKNREKFRNEQKTLQAEINQLTEKKNIYEKNITTLLFSENSPWILMGLGNEINKFADNYTNFIKELAEQQTLQRLSDDPTALLLLPPNSPDKTSLQRMLETGRCEVCGQSAPKNSESWKHIEMVWKRPKQTENSNKNDFSSFYGGIQTTVGSFSLSIPKISQSIEKYRDELDILEELITQKEEDKERAKLNFFNAGGSENSTDITDRQNIADYTLAENTIFKKEEDIKKAETAIKQWQVRLKQIEDEIKSINTDSEIENYRNFKETMANVEDIFLNTKERVFDKILKSLEINANEKYNELTFGNLSAGGKLNFSKQADGTIQVSIKNVNDGELTGLGTGFQRMKQLSIIMAIISSKIGNKQFDYPFISDAPFSEFGDNFINNFFKIAPNVFKQSIIFIKELYDPYSDNKLNTLGNKILTKMENGEIPGTFYVNVIEEKADTTNLVTKNKCYKG
jgi:DNA sulfur modification protein DndD